MTLGPSAQTWVLFVASKDRHRLQQIAQQQGGRLNQYRVNEVIGVLGERPAGLASGWSAVRVESDAPIPLTEESLSGVASPIIAFRGVTQNLHYTSAAQRLDLDARSRVEFEPSNETTAVLIPIGKSLKWWPLAQDQRQAHFQTSADYQGHTAIGAKYVDRVFRRLYHSRYTSPPTPYDFLTYFEFNSAHKEAFRMLLHELRDTARNPEWGYVELEYEIWMTKIG